MHSRGVTILCLGILVGSLVAVKGVCQPSQASPIIGRAGNYQLTEQMLQQAFLYEQIQAGAAFSPPDAAALRADLIATFQREPAKQTQQYEAVAKFLRANNLRNSYVDYAVMRYKQWYALGRDQQAFRDFRNSPFGRMVLKYNPVLVNSDGMIVTQRDVDWQFASDALVAEIAGVAPPTQADKDQFVRSLPSHFASMPKEQQEYLRASQVRLANIHMDIDGTIKTRAAVEADIRQNVHSPADVSREARQIENDSQYGAKYYQLNHAEMTSAFFQAQSVNRQIQGLGRASQGVMKNSALPLLLPNGQAPPPGSGPH
jgi:hypothetical protein